MASLVVFIHIPKTGGTSLKPVLGANAAHGDVKPLGNVFKGAGGLHLAPLERLRTDPGAVSGADIVRGHVPLGVRDHLPADRPVRCFAFLREPVDRLLSHYFQLLDNAARPDGKRPFDLPPLAPDASLEHVLAERYLFDNLQTRMLSGLSEPFGDVTDEMLASAKQNLESGLVVFGLTERFDESLVLLTKRLGYRAVLTEPKRVNDARPRGAEVSADVIATAERASRYDLELYRHAEALFEQAPERGEVEFAIALAGLRAARADGDGAAAAAPPPGFEGGERAWRALVEARAFLLRHDRRDRRAGGGDAEAALARDVVLELEATRARVQRLEQEVSSLRQRLTETNPKQAEAPKKARKRAQRASQEGAPRAQRSGRRRARRTP